MTALLDVQALSIARGRAVLLSNLTFSVERGSLHALVGPNGAGKTTVLSAILGLVPFAGRIVAHWEGTGRVAFVPQQFHVDRTLPITVADFLALSRQKRPVCFGVTPRVQSRVTRLLEKVGLAGFEHRLLSALSGGELRRVLLANALDPLPELLILDEPATGLDENATRWLHETLASLKGDVTVVMVSHDSAHVRAVADRVTALDRTSV